MICPNCYFGDEKWSSSDSGEKALKTVALPSPTDDIIFGSIQRGGRL